MYIYIVVQAFIHSKEETFVYPKCGQKLGQRGNIVDFFIQILVGNPIKPNLPNYAVCFVIVDLLVFNKMGFGLWGTF